MSLTLLPRLTQLRALPPTVFLRSSLVRRSEDTDGTDCTDERRFSQCLLRRDVRLGLVACSPAGDTAEGRWAATGRVTSGRAPPSRMRPDRWPEQQQCCTRR